MKKLIIAALMALLFVNAALAENPLHPGIEWGMEPQEITALHDLKPIEERLIGDIPTVDIDTHLAYRFDDIVWNLPAQITYVFRGKGIDNRKYALEYIFYDLQLDESKASFPEREPLLKKALALAKSSNNSLNYDYIAYYKSDPWAKQKPWTFIGVFSDDTTYISIVSINYLNNLWIYFEDTNGVRAAASYAYWLERIQEIRSNNREIIMDKISH